MSNVTRKKYTKAYEKEDVELSHGLTAGQLDAIHDLQKRGQAIATVKGNMDSSYKVPEYEVNLVHYERTIPQFDPHSGENQSLVSIVKSPVEVYKRDMKRPLGNVKIRVLHDPSKYEKTLINDGNKGFKSKDEPVSVMGNK